MHTVQKIVGSHDGGHIRLLHSLFKCREINLVQGSLINIRRHIVALILLIIAGKMLDTGHYALTLKTDDIACSNLSCKIRVLTEVLEITSAQR